MVCRSTKNKFNLHYAFLSNKTTLHCQFSIWTTIFTDSLPMANDYRFEPNISKRLLMFDSILNIKKNDHTISEMPGISEYFNH